MDRDVTTPRSLTADGATHQCQVPRPVPHAAVLLRQWTLSEMTHCVADCGVEV